MNLQGIHNLWNDSLDRVALDMGVDRWRIEESFAYGACAALARALADRCGMQICIVGDGDSYSHAFCAIAPGFGIDIWGIRSFQEIAASWVVDDPDCRIRAVTAGELEAMAGADVIDHEFAAVPSILANACAAHRWNLQEETERFGCGASGDFAAVLHEMTNWPVMAGIEADGSIGHAWVVNPEGCAFDVNGLHDTEVAPYPAGGSSYIEVRPADLQDIVSDSRWTRSCRYWASDVINSLTPDDVRLGFNHSTR
jgi:hypothetical protein